MNNDHDIHEFENVTNNGHAVSVFNQNGASEEFPILKAFQQYIDSEQAKARKRLISLGVFFGTLMCTVIAVFVALLVGVTNRNQQLNDRLVEFAMKERTSQTGSTAPVVVQSPAPQDSSTIVALTDKIESLRKELADSQKRAESATAEIDRVKAEAAKPKGPSPEQLEIKRLKEMLANEKKAAETEKERLHQLELEKYRREHYPELYAEKKEEKPVDKVEKQPVKQQSPITLANTEIDDVEETKPTRVEKSKKKEKVDIDAILDDINLDDEGISYFDSENKESEKENTESSRSTKPADEPVQKPKSVAAPAPTTVAAPEIKNSIPVEIGGSSSKWLVP